MMQSRPAHQDRPVVLLTGFGPFPNVGANATAVLVPRIAAAARRQFAGVSFVSHVLPTEWQASLAGLDTLVAENRPSVALHFGVSSRARGFDVETRALNACSMSEDAAGFFPLEPWLSASGPADLPVTLPVRHIVERLRRRGLPVQLSRDAGGYLCNALLYRSLEVSRLVGWPLRSGFVHLPTRLVQRRRPEIEPMWDGPLSWRCVIDGSLEIIAAALGQPPRPVVTRPGIRPLGAGMHGSARRGRVSRSQYRQP